MTRRLWGRIPTTPLGVLVLLTLLALAAWSILDDVQNLRTLEDPARSGTATATVTDRYSGLHTWTTWIIFTAADGRQVRTTEWPGSRHYRKGRSYPVRYELADPSIATFQPVRRRLIEDMIMSAGLVASGSLVWLGLLGRSWLTSRGQPPPPPKAPRTRPTPRPRRPGPPKHLA